MSKNKLPPKEVAKYMVIAKEHVTLGGRDGFKEDIKYFSTQKEAKAWAKIMPGEKRLFKISYDFYQRL